MYVVVEVRSGCIESVFVAHHDFQAAERARALIQSSDYHCGEDEVQAFEILGGRGTPLLGLEDVNQLRREAGFQVEAEECSPTSA